MKKGMLMYLLLILFIFMSGCAPSPSTITSTSTPISPTPIPPTETPSLITMAVGGMLQEGNTQPRYKLVTLSSNQLPADSRLGWALGGHNIWNDLKDYEHWVRLISDLGIKRLDTSIQEGEEPILWERPEFDIFPDYDHFIDGLNENGIVVNYLLHFFDKEGHANGEELDTPRFQNEEQIQDFLEYVRFMVSHFKGRIQYYTIWSEPGACGGSGVKCIEPSDYIELAKRTIPVIHEEDPDAKVVMAPIVLFHTREYLFTVIESDVIPMFDVISWHGIYDPAPNSAFYGDYYYEYPVILEDIKQTAYDHGFVGEFWGTENTWCSDEFPSCHAPDQPWEISTTDKIAAKFDARTFIKHLGMDIGVSWGALTGPEQPWAYPTVQRLNTLMAGTNPIYMAIQIENEPPDTVIYTFTLPDGDILIAVWMDNVPANNEDNALFTTLTILDQSAQNVTGIDVLFGYEQELNTREENGNIVLENLSIRDYPIIIKLYLQSD